MSYAYRSNEQSTNTPAVGAIEIDTGNITYLDNPSRAVYVGTAGSLEVIMMDGSSVTFENVEGLLPIRVTAINDSSTADDVVVLF
jgi:hypothetical protein